MDTQHWVEFGTDGSELDRSGEVWTSAPRYRAGESLWVHDGPSVVRIARVSRAHHVGVQDVETGRWIATGGRMVTRGEWYREIDRRSRMQLDNLAQREEARRAWRTARRPAIGDWREWQWIYLVNRSAAA